MVAKTLEDVALADLTADEALTAFGAALKTLTAQTANDIYVALRAWLWKTINARRRDQELREWYTVMLKVGARVEESDRLVATKIEALQDLLYETIGVSEVLPIADVLRRKHVRALLSVIAEAGGRLDREIIARKLGLEQSNLTRVLNLALDTGLIDRRISGKHASFELTKEGVSATRHFFPEPTLPSHSFARIFPSRLVPHRHFGGGTFDGDYATGLEVLVMGEALYGVCDNFEVISEENLLRGGMIAAAAKRTMTTMPKESEAVDKIIAYLAAVDQQDKRQIRKPPARSHAR